MEDRLQSLEELLPTLATKQDIATLSGNVGQLTQDVGQLAQNVGQLTQDVGQLSQNVGQLKQDVSWLTRDSERLSNNVEKLEHRFFQWTMTSLLVGSAFGTAIIATLITIVLR